MLFWGMDMQRHVRRVQGMKNIFRIFLVAGISAAAWSPLFAPFAIAQVPYQANVVGQEVVLQVGEMRQVTFSFKNLGSETWMPGRFKTALFLYGDTSVFGHPSWLRDDIPAVLQQRVRPHQTARVTFWIKAPVVPGMYTERFLLSYGPNRWIKGSVARLQIKVQERMPSTSTVAPSPPPPVSVVPIESASLTTVTASKPAMEWKAELVDKGGIEWQLDPAERTTVTVAFKNAGTATWVKDGKNYVSIYTSTTTRKSVFKDPTWKSEMQPATIREAVVRPGELGHIAFDLRAPNAPGMYAESFQLAAENTAWISGGTVNLPIRVTTPLEFIVNGISNGGGDSNAIEETLPPRGTYKAALLLTSAKEVALQGNGQFAFTYGFKNIGVATWNSLSLRVAGVAPALSGMPVSVRDESWVSATEAVKTLKDTPPGQIGFIGFTLKAPKKKGMYTASFRLYANDQPVEESVIEIPITVTADGFREPEPAPVTVPKPPPPSIPAFGDPVSLPSEPLIRVGLFRTTDDKMTIRAPFGGFLLQEQGNVICRFEAGESVTVVYDRANAVSKASGPRCMTQTSGVYIAVAPDGLSPLEIVDFSRPVAWLPGANDNTFRGKLELRYARATDSVWIINELPIEWYLKGIAETSNSSPQEYQRALLTAARTYAMYHVQRNTKHADEHYTVDAKYDQVYRGYGAEARDPNVVTAVDATRGQIVMYGGKLAITPYYSRSDGRTRSWTEVWGGGPYAWLVSVPVPWDNGKVLWGHGVGLSATGALGMAKEGKTYDQILKYFYTGTELRRAYQ